MKKLDCIIFLCFIHLISYKSYASELVSAEHVLDKLNHKERSILLSGEKLITIEEADGKKWLVGRVITDLPQEELFDVITDQDHYADFFEKIAYCKIVEDHGSWAIADYRLKKVLGKEVHYKLKLVRTPQISNTWTMIEGNIKDTQGGWFLHPFAGSSEKTRNFQGKTLVEYRQHTIPGGLLPTAVVRSFAKSEVPNVLQNALDRAKSIIFLKQIILKILKPSSENLDDMFISKLAKEVYHQLKIENKLPVYEQGFDEIKSALEKIYLNKTNKEDRGDE